jgi:site-specific recombinase XerD
MNNAGVTGPQANPKGLRHAFGTHAIACGVQTHMFQKWMGHTSIKTTAIYANAVGG